GKATFKVESATITAKQRIQIRMVLQKLGCQCKQGEELSAVPEFIQRLKELAMRAGGEQPKPSIPELGWLEEIRLASGNEQLLAIFIRSEEIINHIDTWTELATKIESRWKQWR